MYRDNENKLSKKMFNQLNSRKKIGSIIYFVGFIFCNSYCAAAPLKTPPVLSTNDDIGVNLLTGIPQFGQTDLSIGTGVSKFTHSIATYDEYFWGLYDNFYMGVGNSGGLYKKVVIGHASQLFYKYSGTYYPENGDGASLIEDINGSFTYTGRDGTKLIIANGQPTRLIYPNGLEITVHRGNYVQHPLNGSLVGRVQSVTTNTGIQFKYNYATNIYANLQFNVYPYLSPNMEDARAQFSFPMSIKAINNAIEFCDPLANSCILNNAWPTVQYSWPTAESMFAANGQGNGDATFSVTEPTGAITRYKHSRIKMGGGCSGGFPPVDFEGNPKYTTRITQVKSDNSETKNIVYKNFIQYFPQGVSGGGNGSLQCVIRYLLTDQVNVGNVQWTYDYTQPATPYRTTGRGTGPRGSTNVIMANGGGLPIRFTLSSPDAYANFYEDRFNRVQKVTVYGRTTEYKYDARGNIIERRQKAKSGSALTDLVETAGYDVACNNLKTCNQPNWIKDAKGNKTDFTYHTSSGGVATITGPADVHGIRPQTRNTYQQKYAWFKSSSGNYVRAATPVWLLIKTSSCIKGAASGSGCALANDEVITTFDYGPNAGPNNLFLRGVTVTSGGQTKRTCYAYDIYGNRISVTTPKANMSSCQ